MSATASSTQIFVPTCDRSAAGHCRQAGGQVLRQDHLVEIAGVQPGLRQAGLGRPTRQSRIILAPGKALLLHGRHQPTVDDQGRGRVVVVGRDPEDRAHALWLSAVRTGIGGAALTPFQPAGLGAGARQPEGHPPVASRVTGPQIA